MQGDTAIEAMKGTNPSLGARNCSELSYRFRVSKDVFDWQAFEAAIGLTVPSNRWTSTLRLAKDASTDYHLHVFWKDDDGDSSKVKLQVDFHVWEPESEGEQAAPFAEDFFHWLSQFLKSETLPVHIHAEFELPIEQWRVKIMALPIKVPYGDKTAVIEGLGMRIPSEPEGVRQVWLQRGKKHLTLQLFADRQLELGTFTPQGDVDAFASVIQSLVEEKVNE